MEGEAGEGGGKYAVITTPCVWMAQRFASAMLELRARHSILHKPKYVYVYAKLKSAVTRYIYALRDTERERERERESMCVYAIGL